MYDAENYNMLDAIKANTVAMLYEDDDLETANLLEKIFRDVEFLRIRLNDLEKENKDFHYRAVKAEMRIKTLEKEMEGH